MATPVAGGNADEVQVVVSAAPQLLLAVATPVRCTCRCLQQLLEDLIKS